MKNNAIKLLSLCLVLALCAGCTKDSAGSASTSVKETVSVDASVESSNSASVDASVESGPVAEASVDVTATVGDNYTFSLTDNVSDLIKNFNANGIRVMDAKYSRLYEVDESGKIYYDKTKFDREDPSPVVLVTPDSVPSDTTATIGYLRFIFDSAKFPCSALSLIEGWNGDVENVDKYLTDENSIHEDDYIFAVFKNGRIIPAKDITDKYADSAAKVVECGSLDEYLKAEGLSYFKNEEINRIPSSFTGIESNPTKSRSEGFYSIYFAMIDLSSEYLAGNIDNFGFIIKDVKGYIYVSIATSYDNYMAIRRAEKYHE